MNTKNNGYVWQAIQWPSTEYCTVKQIAGGGYVVESYLTGELSGTPFAFTYKIELTPEWMVIKVGVWSLHDVKQHIKMTYDGYYRWFDEDGHHMPQLDGCTDVDISLTPFTNTLPIKHLDFEKNDKPQHVSVVHISLPDFKVIRVGQEYTRTDSGYVFEDKQAKFRAELVTDSDNIVITYQNLFQRFYPIV